MGLWQDAKDDVADFIRSIRDGIFDIGKGIKNGVVDSVKMTGWLLKKSINPLNYLRLAAYMLKGLWKRSKIVTLAALTVLGVGVKNAWDKPDYDKYAPKQEYKARFDDNAPRQSKQGSRLDSWKHQSMASLGIDDKSPRGVAHPDDSTGSLYVNGHINTKQLFGEEPIYIPRTEYSSNHTGEEVYVAGRLRKMIHQTAEELGDFSNIGNCILMIKDGTNPKNFVNCHLGFRPVTEGEKAGKYNILAAYQTSRICDEGLESASYRNMNKEGIVVNVKMSDESRFSVRLADDGHEGKMVLGKYRPDLPTFHVDRRDGILVVSVDKDKNVTHISDPAAIQEAFDLAAVTDVQESPIYDTNYMTPLKPLENAVVKEADSAEKTTPANITVEQLKRQSGGR